jgi:hypothetical protein
MKNSSIKRNYLFGAFGGLTGSLGITPARGAIAGLTTILLGGGINAAHAFTDANGVTCPQSLVVVFNNGPFCSGGSSSGPTASTPSAPSTQPPTPKFGVPRTAPPIIFPGEGDSDRELRDLYRFIEPGYGNTPGHGTPGGVPHQGYLGMYVSGGPSGDAILGGGGYSLRNSGASITDTAGLIAPGTQSANYRENGGGGGISGAYDASRYVGPNQHLWFNGAFDYTSSNTNFGGAGAGNTINSDNYSFTGSALYANYNAYLLLKGSYQFGNSSEFTAADGSTGRYNSDGYDIDAKVGHVFLLFNTLAQPVPSRLALKAPPRPIDGYGIGLDLSGHLGYASNVARGFTDTAGFMFGNERAQGGETGLNAKLFAEVPHNGVTWQPYIAGSVDWRFSYSNVANFPGQLALATGDAVSFADATTVVGAKAGLDVTTSNGWTVGANGFYEHSSDTEIVGGKAYVKIPFGATAVTARY